MRPPGTEGLWGRWQWTDLREMLAYGGRSTVFNWFNYAATKADTVLVGELLRPTLRLEAAGQRLVCMTARRI